jgi:hypothetical protein
MRYNINGVLPKENMLLRGSSQILTGHIPYSHYMQNWKVVRDIMHSITPLRRKDAVVHGSKELQELLNDCWAFNPEERPDMDMESRLGMVLVN